MLGVIACITLTAIAKLSCPPTPSGLFPPQSGEPTRKVYIISLDWHAGLAWSQQDLVPMGPETWRNAPYIEVGWGERAYYYGRENSLISILRAFFIPGNSSTIHVAAYRETPPLNYKNQKAEVWSLELSESGFTNLFAYVNRTFKRDARGDRLPPLPGKGLSSNSNFYDAIPAYNLWFTCNTWVAAALNAAGVPTCSSLVWTPQNLFDRISHIATRESL